MRIPISRDLIVGFWDVWMTGTPKGKDLGIFKSWSWKLLSLFDIVSPLRSLSFTLVVETEVYQFWYRRFRLYCLTRCAFAEAVHLCSHFKFLPCTLMRRQRSSARQRYSILSFSLCTGSCLDNVTPMLKVASMVISTCRSIILTSTWKEMSASTF